VMEAVRSLSPAPALSFQPGKKVRVLDLFVFVLRFWFHVVRLSLQQSSVVVLDINASMLAVGKERAQARGYLDATGD